MLTLLDMENASRSKTKTIRILVAGGSGFIGRRLISRLSTAESNDETAENKKIIEIVCMTRRPDSIRGLFRNENVGITVVKGDVSNYDDLQKIMSKGIDVAYYLVHSMEGGSKD